MGTGKSFDTHNNIDESNRFRDLIKANKKNIIMMAIQDEGMGGLQSSAKTAIRQLGSTVIDKVGHRESWAFIGKNGKKISEMRGNRKIIIYSKVDNPNDLKVYQKRKAEEKRKRLEAEKKKKAEEERKR